MSDPKVYYRAETVFDNDGIRQMFQAEYYSYESLRILLRAGLGAIILLCALFLVESNAIKGVLLMIGCWFLVSTDFPSRMRAEQLIQSRKGLKSRVNYRFMEKAVMIDGADKEIAYENIDRMLVDKNCFYLFENPESAVMVSRKIWTKDEQQSFVNFISEKTGKEWKQSRSIIGMNLRDLIDMIRDRKKWRVK